MIGFFLAILVGWYWSRVMGIMDDVGWKIMKLKVDVAPWVFLWFIAAIYFFCESIYRFFIVFTS